MTAFRDSPVLRRSRNLQREMAESLSPAPRQAGFSNDAKLQSLRNEFDDLRAEYERLTIDLSNKNVELAYQKEEVRLSQPRSA
jgi:hypothetical protein